MEVDDVVSAELCVLVRRIAKEVLVADNNQIATHLPSVDNSVVGLDLQAVLRDAGEMIATPHLNVAIAIGKGIAGRAQSERTLKGRVDEAVTGAHLPLVVSIADARLDPLPPRAADILEEAAADDRARDIEDVIAKVGSEGAEVPIDLARGGPGGKPAAQASLVGIRDDLLQLRRIGDEEVVESARARRIRTRDLAGGGRAVCFGVTDIAR